MYTRIRNNFMTNFYKKKFHNFSDSEIITEKVGGHVKDLIWLNYDSILKLVPVNLLHGQPQGQDDLSI